MQPLGTASIPLRRQEGGRAMAEKTKEEKKGAKQEERPALVPWRPFEEFDLGPSVFGEWPFSSSRLPRPRQELLREGPWTGRRELLIPAMDVRENDQQYSVTVELPGVRKEDVHVEIEEGVLTIRGEKASERDEKKEHCRYTERTYGSFRRSFRLPSDADADRLDASFKDGVLAVTIPRTEAAKPRTIAIKA
jgi:HSP20 family protein